MFKPPLHALTILAIILFACPAFAGSTTYQISVTVPMHTQPGTAMTEQILANNVPKVHDQQVIQQEDITRNDQTVTVRSVVVL